MIWSENSAVGMKTCVFLRVTFYGCNSGVAKKWFIDSEKLMSLGTFMLKMFPGNIFFFSRSYVLGSTFWNNHCVCKLYFQYKKESPHLHLMKWAARLGFILPMCQGEMRMGENLTALSFRSGNGEDQEFCLKRAILHLTVSSYFLNFHLKVKFNMSRSCSSSLEFIGPYRIKSTSNENAFRYIQSQSNEEWFPPACVML